MLLFTFIIANLVTIYCPAERALVYLFSHLVMDILVEDLGPTEVIKLYGKQLKAAREKISVQEMVRIPICAQRLWTDG